MLYLMFSIGPARYLLSAECTEGVLPLVRLKSIAGAPSWVASLFEYRRQVVPVIDVTHAMFGIPAARKMSTRIALIQLRPYPEQDQGRGQNRSKARMLGLILEQATDTVRISDSDFETAPITLPGVHAMGAITKYGPHILQRLEPEHLVTSQLQSMLYQTAENDIDPVASDTISVTTLLPAMPDDEQNADMRN